MHCDAIMEGFWIFQKLNMLGSAYASIIEGSESGWIIPEQTVLTIELWVSLVKVSWGFEYASGSTYPGALNMSRLWICEGYTGCWMCLYKP